MRLRWVLLVCLIFPALPIRAQIDGRISGSVVDASGAAVASAEVELFLPGGKKPLLTTRTSVDGLYHLIGVRAGEFDLTVETAGFETVTLHNVTVDPARETTVSQVKLQVAAVTQTIEVTEHTQGAVTTNAEISQTISMEEIQNLPIFDRDPMGLIQTQPGVVLGNSTTVINGLRTSYSDVTLDGINIQDNYIRDNGLDFSPNKLLISQVRQVTLVTSNGNAALSGGATEEAFTTPSGSNHYHGEAFWYNRNNAFSANDWFNNQAGVGLPFLNQNQMGGNVGGAIIKDKLFFYGAYEAVRTHAQEPAETAILTATARQGIFSYPAAGGTVRQVDILKLRGISIDPVMQTLLNQVPGPQYINDKLIGDDLNYSGYRFNQRSNGTRDNVTGRIDYNLSTAHVLGGTYAWNRYDSDRPDAENDYSLIPKVYNPTHTNFLALSWRWTPTARLTNDLRAGFNLSYAYFLSSQKFGPDLLEGTLFSDPVNEFMPQGRSTNTYNIADDASFVRGNHFLQFGFFGQQVRTASYDQAGVIPIYGLAMGTGQPRATLQSGNLPGGVSATDLDTANALLATLGGYVDNYSQTFNVTSRTSGYVPGAAYLRHFRMNDYAVYVQDKWKIKPRLTATLGLRWDLPSVVDEANGLELQPILNGTAEQTLLSNSTLDFVGRGTGRPWYHRDWHSFAPNIGLAWDPFGKGKTSVRAAYSIFYVNDEAIGAAESMVEANSGLQGLSQETGLSNRVSAGLPAIFQPTYGVPRKFSDNYAEEGFVTNPFNVVGMVDPNLRRPYVQQYSIGIQQEVLSSILEVRYVGNHGVGEYRSFDYNQVNINAGGFLQDFLRAQNNGNLALKQTGVFNPVYNSGIPGSQQLPVFKTLSSGGLLTDGDVVNLIQTGQVADLAYLYQSQGYNGPPGQEIVPFFPQPYALGSDILTNYSQSTYNSLQVELRHRTHSGLSFEANYTFSKVLSDADGDVQSRIQHFLDIHNPGLERSRANFDLTHMIKADGFYELPIGKDHRLHYGPLDRVIGGWVYGAVMTWQSGTPFSILSGYGTFNRSSNGRAYYNTADIAVGGAALKNTVSYRMTGNGPMVVAPSAVQANGSGVANLGDDPFSGEVFFNPGAGSLGVLQRRMFSGPWTFDIDMSLRKVVKITESSKLEIHMDAFNALNHATFWAGDQNINSTTFGLMSSMFYLPRVLQFGAHFKF